MSFYHMWGLWLELPHCQCKDTNCPTYFFKSPQAAQELERLLSEALAMFQQAYPTLRGQIQNVRNRNSVVFGTQISNALGASC